MKLFGDALWKVCPLFRDVPGWGGIHLEFRHLEVKCIIVWALAVMNKESPQQEPLLSLLSQIPERAGRMVLGCSHRQARSIFPFEENFFLSLFIEKV